MGILGITTERAKMAIVIASTMQSMCHKCPYAVESRHFGKRFKEPDTQSEYCRGCLDVNYQKTFGGKLSHDDNA